MLSYSLLLAWLPLVFPLDKIPTCGQQADRDEFAWRVTVTMGPGGSPLCTGTLLAADTVLTAGHCCDGMAASRLAVEVGNYMLHEQDPDQASISVKGVYLHEHYDSWTISNDICLLKLEGSADLSSPSIGLALLPAEEPPAGSLCTIAAWAPDCPAACPLSKLEVPVWAMEDCQDSYGDTLGGDNICAGMSHGGCDFCQGNSGGGLVCWDGVIVGLASWGYGCGQPGYPTVYTSVAYFSDWIQSHMNM